MGSNVLIIQAGEITPVTNSIFYGILNEAKHYDGIKTVYGSINSMGGILSGKFRNLSDMGENVLSRLKTSSVSLLRSMSPMFYNPAEVLKKDDYPIIKKRLKEYDIQYLIVLFNLNSFYKCMELKNMLKDEEIKMICIPDSIVSDICETDHTLGFASCARFIAVSLNNLYSYCYNMNTKIAVVQVPGNTGWLAASSALLKSNPADPPQLIYTPEHPFSMVGCLESIRQLIENKVENIMIVVSEWLVDEYSNRYIYTVRDMDFSIALHIYKVVQAKLHIYAVPVIFNTFACVYPELGSDVDFEEAAKCGEYAVKHLNDDYKSCFISIKRLSDEPYQSEFSLSPLYKIIGKQKKLPDIYLNNDFNNIDGKYLNYIKPLIKPEIHTSINRLSESNIDL